MKLAPFRLAALISSVALAAHADPCKAVPDHGRAPAELLHQPFSGRVTYVGDGDSLCVALGPSPSEWVEVRLEDFYAPELHEGGGAAAKANLSRLVMGRILTCHPAKQSYDRIVATCMLGSRSVGDMLRASGEAEGGRGYYRRR
jgi:endonuclease YncB( thermonuclease family)